MTLLLPLLKPLARILLRQHIGLGEAVQALRESYVSAAEDQLNDSGESPTNARIAVLTGLDRNEVSRIRRGVDRSGQKPADEAPAYFLNRAARIVTNWPRVEGRPCDLPYTGEGSFSELVKAHSGGVPAHSLLEELKRNGSACECENGHIRLLDEVFVPSGSDAKLQIASAHLARLAQTIDHNLEVQDGGYSHPQLELLFRNLGQESAEFLRDSGKDRVRALLQELALSVQAKRSSLGDHYLDNDPVNRQTGIGIYFFDINNND